MAKKSFLLIFPYLARFMSTMPIAPDDPLVTLPPIVWIATLPTPEDIFLIPIPAVAPIVPEIPPVIPLTRAAVSTPLPIGLPCTLFAIIFVPVPAATPATTSVPIDNPILAPDEATIPDVAK